MTKPKALVTVPDNPYFLWQMLVNWTHMQQYNYPTQYLSYCGQGGPSPELKAIMRDSGAKITVWNDWRINPQYNPSMKPALVGRWLDAHPEDVETPLLLLDPDALPLTAFIRSDIEPEPDQWFGTDTDSYTGPGYLKSKGEDLWLALCELVRVDPEQAGRFPGRGSQWVFTGRPGSLWLEIAELSDKAYPILTQHRSDVQTWCAEMYVTQLVLVREQIAPATRAPMRMVWADGKRSDWSRSGFFHCAGVTEPGTGHFHKGSWNSTAPFFVDDLGAEYESASARYVDLIRDTEQKYPELCRLLAREERRR